MTYKLNHRGKDYTLSYDLVRLTTGTTTFERHQISCGGIRTEGPTLDDAVSAFKSLVDKTASSKTVQKK